MKHFDRHISKTIMKAHAHKTWVLSYTLLRNISDAFLDQLRN